MIGAPFQSRTELLLDRMVSTTVVKGMPFVFVHPILLSNILLYDDH